MAVAGRRLLRTDCSAGAASARPAAAGTSAWPPMSAASAARRAAALTCFVLAGLLLVPLALRGATRAPSGPGACPRAICPSIEGPRERAPFDASRSRRSRGMQPGLRRHRRLDGRIADRSAAVRAASAGRRWRRSSMPAAARRLVVPRAQELGHRQRHPPAGAVFIFFRDTNLTNVLFRIDATVVARHRRARARGRSQRRGRAAARDAFYRVRAAFDRRLRRDRGAALDRAGWSTSGRRGLMFPTGEPRAAFMQAAERPLRPRPPAADGRRRHAGDRGSRGRLRRASSTSRRCR